MDRCGEGRDLRILIADDEQPVLESLQFILERFRPGMAVAAAVSSGRAAVEAAAADPPDMVVMDVSMPGISGLDALREIRRLHPQVVSILLTAYERFDVAQEALELGVYDYILKPFTRDKILKALDGAAERVMESQGGETAFLEGLEKKRQIEGLLEAAFMRSVTQGKPHTGILEFLRENWGLKGDKGRVIVLTDRGGEQPAGRAGGLEEIVKRFCFRYRSLAVEDEPGRRLICVVDSRDAGDAGSFRDMDRYLGDLIRKSRADQGGKDGGAGPAGDAAGPAWGIGGRRVLGEAAFSYREALEDRRRREEGRESAGTVPPGPLEFLREEQDAFLSHLRKGREEELNTLIRRVVENPRWSWEEKRFLAFDLAHLAETETGHPLGERYELASCDTPEALFSRFRMLLHLCRQRMTQLSGETLPPLLKRSLRLMEERYREPLQQGDIAEELGISSSYLSQLFSKHGGMGFVDYLTEIRIGRAKELLEAGNLSIQEVSAAVGYQDPNYFSRLFKRVTGVSPSRYSGKSPSE